MKVTWNPVIQWLNEVGQSAEIESLSALQAKSVALRLDDQDALAVRNAQVSMQNVHKHSLPVLKELQSLSELLPLSLVHIDSFRHRFLDLCTPLCQLLELCRRRCAMNQHAQSNGSCVTTKSPSISKSVATPATTGLGLGNANESAESLYESVCTDSKHVLRLLHTFVQRRQVQNVSLETALQRLADRLQRLIEQTLSTDSSRLVDALYAAERDGLCLKWTLLALWQLTQTEIYFRALFATRASILKPLANLLSESHHSETVAGKFRHDQLRCAALRVFTHLCARPETALIVCSRTAIGPRLTRLLNSASCGRLLQIECVRLVVQLTRALSDANASQSSSNPNVKNEVEPFDAMATRMQQGFISTTMRDRSLSEQIASQLSLDQLVECLTGLLIEGDSNDSPLLLLCCAAFANISFVDCYPFIHHRTLHVILHVLDFDRMDSIAAPRSIDTALLDQMLTLLANLADQYPTELLDARALQVLVQALQPNADSSHEPIDSGTQERVQQKAATAIGRLVLHIPLASAIQRMHVLERLIAICINPRLRNHSEHVLLASLAALRRAAVTLGPGPFERLQQMDLIQLPLRDAFTKYSVGHELYV